MESVAFEDVHEYDARMFYAMTNENLEAWDTVLDGIEAERGAGICSGGEVCFFSLLPRIKEELVCIDHTYASLYYAIGKYVLVKKLGAKKAHEIITACAGSGDWGDYPRAYVRINTANNTTAPPINATSVTLPPPEPGNIAINVQLVKDLFEKANDGLPTHKGVDRKYFQAGSMGRLWDKFTPEMVSVLHDKHDKVHFLHGDIDDLLLKGQFDLLYLSNALDYVGRGGKGDFQIEHIVKPGGFVAHCFLNDPYRKAFKHKALANCTVVSQTEPDARRSYGLRWTYEVRQTPQ